MNKQTKYALNTCTKNNNDKYSAERYWKHQLIGPVGRVFANGLGDWGSIPGRVIPKTQKIVLDASLLNTQHYKVRNKGKVEQSPFTSV